MDRSSILLSLQQDLEELRSVTCEMQTHASWLIPFNPGEISTTEDAYTSYLELVLDKLSLIVSLLALYIANSGGNPRNVRKPKRLSLAKNIEIIWRRIKSFASPITSFIAASSTNKHTQTNETTLPQCDGCNVAQECIATIVTALGTTGFDSFTKLTKQQLNLFEITLFGCMKKLCSSIISDINLLILKHIENGNELRVTALRLQELTRGSELLAEEYGLLKEQYRTCRIEKEALNEQNCALSSVKVQVDELRLEGGELRVAVGNCRRQVEVCRELNEKIAAKQKERDADMEVVLEFKQLQGAIVEIQQKMSLYEDATTRSNEFIKKIGDKSENIIEELYEIIKREIFKRNIAKKPDIKGDPIEDMIERIDLNNRHIKELQDENTWLTSLVVKLKRCKSKVK